MTYREAETVTCDGDPRWCVGVLCVWEGPISEAGMKDGDGYLVPPFLVQDVLRIPKPEACCPECGGPVRFVYPEAT